MKELVNECNKFKTREYKYLNERMNEWIVGWIGTHRCTCSHSSLIPRHFSVLNACFIITPWTQGRRRFLPSRVRIKGSNKGGNRGPLDFHVGSELTSRRLSLCFSLITAGLISTMLGSRLFSWQKNLQGRSEEAFLNSGCDEMVWQGHKCFGRQT